MNRREVLKSVGLVVGGTIIGGEAFLTGCSFSKSEGILDKGQIALLEEVAETILPHTEKSLGAKEAKVGGLINRMVSDFYNPFEQQAFIEGLAKFEEIKFVEKTAMQREEYLKLLEKQAEENPILIVTNEAGESEETSPAFVMIRQLTIWSFMSSEVLAKSTSFNYLPVPGAFQPCVEVNATIKPMYPSDRFGKVWKKDGVKALNA